MKRTSRLLQAVQLSVFTATLLIGVLGYGFRAQADSEPFSAIPAFGDSLTDTGNLYLLTGGYPATGRFCNGPLWVEYLAADLGMTYRAGDNYAVGGATTGRGNFNDGPGREYPGLQDEIDSYINSDGVTEPERALFLVGAGANDFFNLQKTGESPQSMIANGVNNTVTAVQRLWSSGARFIMVMNVPDLGVTPYALSSGNAALMTQLCAAYNHVLGLVLDQLSQAGVPTLRLDAFAVLDKMASEPATYGFSNVTVPLTMAPAGVDPAQFLFWDGVHPTSGAHKVLAAEAIQQLMNRFSPSQGKGTPEAKINGLHGLVNAQVHNP